MGSELSKIFVSVDDIPHTVGGFVQLLFLAAVYGYILCYASNMIKDGSELLLLVPSLAGVVGSIVLPVLGAVPDGALVIFSGLGPDAQKQISVGVGALAGSTIMLLTVPWVLAIIAGRVNIVNGKCMYRKPSSWPKGTPFAKLVPPNALLGTGVCCGPTIRKSAVVMMITLIPYLVIQIPSSMHNCTMEKGVEKGKCQTQPTAALVGGVLATLFFVGYLIYQARMAAEDPVKEDLIDEVRRNAVRRHMVSIRGLFPDTITDSEGAVPISATSKRFQSYLLPFFKKYDLNGDGFIDQQEFTRLLIDLGERPSPAQAEDLLKEVDSDGNGILTFVEFCECIVRIITDPTFSRKTNSDDRRLTAAAAAAQKRSSEETPLLNASAGESGEPEEEDEEDEEVEMPEDLCHLSPSEQQKRVLRRSAWLMFVGVGVVLLFSDPMVDVLSAVGEHTGIRPFFIAFVLAPLASNASELIAAYTYALKKTQKTISISFASLIGAACMNNTFCLAMFLFLVYAKRLEWTFTAETISIIVIEALMFFFAVQRTHRWYYAIAVALLFPFALALVVGLEAYGFD